MVKLFYKDAYLGTLNFDDNGFVYNSNLIGETNAVDKYFLNVTNYNLFGSKNKTSKVIFKFFEDMANQVCSRPDLVKALKITSADTQFDVLQKLGKIKQSEFGFWIANN